MNLAERMADIITNHFTALKTFIEFQDAKGLPESEFEIVILEMNKRIAELIKNRTQTESWLGFLEYIYRPGISEETKKINNDLRQAAVKGWEAGYVCGFADRENLLLYEAIDGDEEDDCKKEETLASAPTSTRESF